MNLVTGESQQWLVILTQPVVHTKVPPVVDGRSGRTFEVLEADEWDRRDCGTHRTDTRRWASLEGQILVTFHWQPARHS